MAIFSDDRAEDVIKDFQQRSDARGVWEDYWDEIAELVDPNLRDTIRPHDFATPGERKFDRQVDSTATRALPKFASIMDSLLTPKNSTWHRLRPSDRNLLRSRNVRLYFEELTRLLFDNRYDPKANFSSNNQLVFRGLGSMGTGTIFVDKPDREFGLRYKSIHVGQLYPKENHQGIVDDLIRRFTLKAEQIVRVKDWEEQLTDEFLREARSNPTREFTLLNRVKPRDDFDETALDERAMRFESLTVLKEKKLVLKSSGFRTFPYAVTRFEQSPNEVFGRSPAMQVFASIRTLQVQKRIMLKQGHRAVDPILLIHDDGHMEAVSLRPGAMIPGGVNADGRPLVQPLPTGSPALGQEMMDIEIEAIKDAFLIQLFQLLTETPRMTATEVLERAREKSMLLAPTVGRQESEYLGPMIEREIEVLNQQGLLPDMPPELLEAQGEFTIVYDSPLSKLARAEEAAGLNNTLQTILPIIQTTQDPSPLDNFDFDVITRDLSDIQAVPQSWLKGLDEVAALRQARQLAAQRAQQLEAAPKLLQAEAKAKQAGLTAEDL